VKSPPFVIDVSVNTPFAIPETLSRIQFLYSHVVEDTYIPVFNTNAPHRGPLHRKAAALHIVRQKHIVAFGRVHALQSCKLRGIRLVDFAKNVLLQYLEFCLRDPVPPK
jgi:hypothetical protein